MTENKLEISDYGLYLLSPEKLSTFLSDSKIRSKKILKYFQDNQKTYLKSIEQGVWLPILPIDSIEYIIKLGLNEKFDEKYWIETHKEEGFNLEIGKDNNLWIGSISNLYQWEKDKFNNQKKYNSYETLDNEVIFDSFGYNVEKGKYLVDIIGYKRIQELDYPEANYGFLFNLKRIDDFSGYKDPREDDKYFFNLTEI